MATQSLYRRYRPRRFSEVKGQEHIVRALRNAVINEREGQAYLFSGPRGTGKTTSARILAKVLNCENPQDGEPCCACESCIAVERGTSYDVHELDAASNNGVDAMRDLIEKASLGTPGRHKVYILDEVHMLSKQAEAALLKTLEEPPPHVVFVLATTDPQKVSDTIRSRTQHLRFHLLPMDELEAHVRWVVEDAGLTVSESALQSILEQGGGSARDTLSALELAAASGGDDVDAVQHDEFVESLIAMDPGRALAAVAHAVHRGRDPRALTEDVVRHLRDCFLMLMAPELVALPEQKAATVSDQAARLGAGKVVRAIERLGEMLVEMRHVPDPRLLLEVAFVQLTHEQSSHDLTIVLDRLERLEAAVAAGAAAPPPPAPIDPATGRVQLGGRARQQPSPPRAAPAPAPEAPSPAVPTAPARPAPTQNRTPQQPAPGATAPAVPTAATPPADAQPSGRGEDLPPAPPAASRTSVGTSLDTPVGTSVDDLLARAGSIWATDVVSSLKPLVRAIFSVPKVLGARDGALALGAPNDAHRARCEQHRPEVEAAIAQLLGSPVRITIVVEGSLGADDAHDGRDQAELQRSSSTGGHGDARVVALRPGAPPPADEDVDLTDLVDVPPESVVTPLERLAQVFPGSKLMDERP
jgi:DNA polymerase-3 subunit gamma/tau